MAEHEGIWSEYRPTYWDGWSAVKRMGDLVRCKDCALYDREDGLCYRDPNHSGYYRPAHDDGFCAWGEKREDQR